MRASNYRRILQTAFLSGVTFWVAMTSALAQSQATDHTAHHPVAAEQRNAGAAEQPAAASPAQPGVEGKGTPSETMQSMSCGMMSSMMPSSAEERVSKLHDTLRITEAQEPKWAAFANALRDARQSMSAMADDMNGAAGRGLPDRIGRHVVALKAHLNALEAAQVAAVHLYGALSATQKSAADQAFHGMGMM